MTCCVCGKAKPPRARGRTCGDRICRGLLSARREASYQPQWPSVGGEIVADFSGHDVDARDGGYGFKIIRADDRSYAGCSAAYAAGVA
jgi:hypothetical protein